MTTEHSMSLDDEYLLRFVLKKTRAELLADTHTPIPRRALLRFKKLKKMRTHGVPIQYIVGAAWFFGMKFKVTPSVLIPRPETELMVEHINARVAEHKKCSVIDLGTGSGAIACAVAKNCRATVSAVDISKRALTVARAKQVSISGWKRPRKKVISDER